MGEELRNTESDNAEHCKPCSDSEKENVIQHKEDDVAKTKSTANNNVVTNDTHYDNPDTVQNEDDVPDLAQNGIESTCIESSLPGQEIDKLPKAKDKIKYRFQGNTEWQEAEVLGRAVKYKSWFNIKNTCDDGASSIDIDKIAEWEMIDTFSEEVNIVMIPAH